MAIERKPSATPIPWMRLLGTAAVFSIGTIGFLMILGSHPAAPATIAPGTAAKVEPVLGLKVTVQPHQLEIYWNHEAKPLTGSTKAVMRISEGDIAQVVPLDRNDLRDGHITYLPRTNDVRVRFEVSPPKGDPISESMRVVAIP